MEAQLVLERDDQREAALDIAKAIRGRGIRLLPLTSKVAAEADRLRAQVPVLHVFDGFHLATAKLSGETIPSSDKLFPLRRYVPVEPLP